MVGASYNNGALEIWSVDGERSILHVAGSRSSFAQAAFQPKSTKLLLSSAIEGVFRFDTETGAREKILISGTNLLAMRFAPSGEQFAVVRPNMVEIWQAEPLKRLRQIPIGAASAWMAWSPDSRQLAVGSGQERIVLLLDANSGKPLMRLFGHRLSPVRWEFHPSGHWLGSIGWDRTLRVWDVRTGEQLLSIGASPRALAFSEDGGRIATAPKDDGVALFEWADTSVFREFAGNTVGKEGVYGLASSRDGRFLLSGSDLGVRIWDTRAAAEIGFIATPNPGFVSVFFSRQSDAVLYSTRNLGTIRRTFAWHEDSASGRAIPEFGPEEHIALPTNTVLLYVSADERHWLVETRGAGAELWRREDSGQMKLLLARGGRINPDFSRHGRWFSAGTYAGDDVDVFEISSGLKVATLAGHKANLVRFSPDSRWLITCDSSEYRCWQTSTWKPGSILPAELGGLKAGHLTFSPDGKLLAVQRGDDDVQLWELPQFRPLVHLRAPHALGLHALQLNAAGTRLWLLCEGHRVFEWNLTNLRHELAKLGLDWQDGR
jgi:WD40 repeat protein